VQEVLAEVQQQARREERAQRRGLNTSR